MNAHATTPATITTLGEHLARIVRAEVAALGSVRVAARCLGVSPTFARRMLAGGAA